MDAMELLRLFAAVTTVAAAIMVALNWSPRVTVWGFAVFIVASIAWMVDGWLEAKASLLIQNAVLLLVNIAGVYRWLPRANSESPSQSKRNHTVRLPFLKGNRLERSRHGTCHLGSSQLYRPRCRSKADRKDLRTNVCLVRTRHHVDVLDQLRHLPRQSGAGGEVLAVAHRR
jgi:hypothetical protein